MGVSLNSKTHPLLKYSSGTSTQCYAYHYPSLFSVLFLQYLERSIGGRTQSIIGRGYKELELSQVIPADRPYVGLLVIFPAYLLPGRSEALTKTTNHAMPSSFRF